MVMPFALAPLPDGYGTGLEWMPVAAVLLAIVTLILVLWYGSRNAV